MLHAGNALRRLCAVWRAACEGVPHDALVAAGTLSALLFKMVRGEPPLPFARRVRRPTSTASPQLRTKQLTLARNHPRIFVSISARARHGRHATAAGVRSTIRAPDVSGCAAEHCGATGGRVCRAGRSLGHWLRGWRRGTAVTRNTRGPRHRCCHIPRRCRQRIRAHAAAADAGCRVLWASRRLCGAGCQLRRCRRQ
jgi:hypothetical protein